MSPRGRKAAHQAVSEDYSCSTVERIRQGGYHLNLGQLQIYLAREFGFCYGVQRAVDYAYQTRQSYPGRRIFLTTEIIHNPRVNKRLLEMGIRFLTGHYNGVISFDELQPDDVVILPAFGASLELLSELRAKGCTLVDTTCGSVIQVWNRVEEYARDGFTSVIHGRFSHEETVSTCSRIARYPQGRYIVLRDAREAELLCGCIRGEVSPATVRSKLWLSASPNFDPRSDLERVGVANQTTMLSGESLEISNMLRDAIVARYGEDSLAGHFRSFETVCTATQQRQDAIRDLAGNNLDLILIIGGFNSSNTSHLLQIASEHTRAYHIEDASGIVSVKELRHKRIDSREVETALNWLPPAPLRVGFTAGASTPNRAIGEVVERIIELRGSPLKNPALAAK